MLQLQLIQRQISRALLPTSCPAITQKGRKRAPLLSLSFIRWEGAAAAQLVPTARVVQHSEAAVPLTSAPTGDGDREPLERLVLRECCVGKREFMSVTTAPQLFAREDFFSRN